VRTWVLLAGLAVLSLGATGCISPLSMGIFTPIPVPVWVTEYMEERACYATDHKAVIMPPIPAGYRPYCEDPPDKATILRAWPKVVRGIAYVYEEFRDDIDIAVEKIVDTIDPPRFFPLVGPAQLHHCHYKVTIYYTETIQSSYPFPFKCMKRRQQVIYMDRDHLHLYACTPEQAMSFARDTTNR
jgi:hypothetical protein